MVVISFLWDKLKVGDYFGSRMSESGKIDARDAKLDKLVIEIEALTKASENIKTELSTRIESLKAEMSHENWLKQQRWIKKTDCYVELIDSLYKYELATLELRVTHPGWMKSISAQPSQVVLHAKSLHSKAFKEYNSSVRGILRTKAVAGLMCNNDDLKPIFEWFPPAFTDPTLETVLKDAGSKSLSLAKLVIGSARKDLGYSS